MPRKTLGMRVFRRTILLAFLCIISLGHCFPLRSMQRNFLRTIVPSEIGIREASSPSVRVRNSFGKPSTALWRKIEATAGKKTLGATSQPSEYPTQLTANTAFDFPTSKECYRNLTRAVEYSIVVDYDEENSQDLNFYKRLSRTPLEHFLQDTAMRTNTMVSLSSDNHSGSQVSFGWLFSKGLPKRLGFLVLWWQSLFSSRILAPLFQKLKQPFRKNKSSGVGFYTGGTKRHYALLVACLLNGNLCSSHHWRKDPLAYHRAIVESAHQRTIASLSPSTLSLGTKNSATSFARIHVSALENHALRWALRQRRKK